MSWVENVLTHLSNQGHRVTEPRRAILERIVRYTQPFGTEQLYQDLGGEGGPIGRATVYRPVSCCHATGRKSPPCTGAPTRSVKTIAWARRESRQKAALLRAFTKRATRRG